MKSNLNPIKIDGKIKYIIVSIYAILILLSSFLFNTPQEILQGMKNIVVSPSILVSDYFAVGNLGAAIFNSGLLMIISVLLALFNKLNLSGPVIAGIFTVGGFALFGKNIYNYWAIIFGVYLYAVIKKEDFKNYLVIAFFATTLSPLISKVSFDFALSPLLGIALGNLSGLLVGLIMAPLAYHLKNTHMGYNHYNVGFTGGIIGTLFMSIFRILGFDSTAVSIIAEGYNKPLTIYLGIIIFSMIILGFVLNGMTFRGYKNLLESPGTPPNDYIDLYGFGLSFINMGIMGLISLIYILLVGGQLNGPTIGGIFTVVGFAAFGKHPKNSIPIMLGVFLTALLTDLEVTSTVIVFTALFATALAPVAGKFGPIAGIIAGFVHTSIVLNLGVLHGGTNLYNNGFSAGIVAAILVPIFTAFKKIKEDS